MGLEKARARLGFRWGRSSHHRETKLQTHTPPHTHKYQDKHAHRDTYAHTARPEVTERHSSASTHTHRDTHTAHRKTRKHTPPGSPNHEIQPRHRSRKRLSPQCIHHEKREHQDRDTATHTYILRNYQAHNPVTPKHSPPTYGSVERDTPCQTHRSTERHSLSNGIQPPPATPRGTRAKTQTHTPPPNRNTVTHTQIATHMHSHTQFTQPMRGTPYKHTHH